MHRLVQRAAMAASSAAPSEADGSMPSEPVSHGRLVRQHVAEQIVGDDDVELLRLAHQLHGAIVGEDVVERDVAVALVVHVGDHLVPQHAGLHHVALLGGVHQALALAGEIEGDAAMRSIS